MFHIHALKALTVSGTALCLSAGLALADQVILDDLIVDGSACIGFDCVNGESFGFDTLRLKENNLRISAVDTSSTASFPTTDWQLTFNETSNGGANKFSIDDLTAGRTPFTIEGSAPTHALYVDDGGRIGLGTSTPVVEAHIKDGDTPTLRLEQDGSSGFTPQSWDLAGNETNFFVRDVTNGSQLPFRIRPGAPTNAIDVAADGDVFLGVANSTTNSGDLVIGATNNSTVRLLDIASSTAAQIRIVGDTENRRIVARDADTGAADVQILLKNDSIVLAGASDVTNTWATISAAGIVTDIGSCTTALPCDAVFDPTVYDVPSIETHAALMWENMYLPAVGPTRQGDSINVTAKMTGMLNELEHAHIYIEQLHGRVAALEEMLAAAE